MFKKDVTFDGIVIKNTRYKEADALVVILTKQYGVKTFLVRGVGKSKSKLAGSVIPYSNGQYIGSINDSGLSYITAANSVEASDSIFTDMEKSAYVAYILDLAAHAFADSNTISDDWFNFFNDSIKLIEKDLDPQIIANIVQIQLLEVFGVFPELKKCVIGAETDGEFDYSESYGGILCKKHYSFDENRLHAGQRVIYYLRLFSEIKLANINTINIKLNTKNQLKHIIDMIYDESVGLNLKTKQFIDKLSKFSSEY